MLDRGLGVRLLTSPFCCFFLAFVHIRRYKLEVVLPIQQFSCASSSCDQIAFLDNTVRRISFSCANPKLQMRIISVCIMHCERCTGSGSQTYQQAQRTCSFLPVLTAAALHSGTDIDVRAVGHKRISKRREHAPSFRY
jgi:hypothetical protein